MSKNAFFLFHAFYVEPGSLGPTASVVMFAAAHENLNFAFVWPHGDAVQYDATNDVCTGRRCRLLYWSVVLGSCACSLAMLPFVALEFDDWSKALKVSLTALCCSVGTVFTLVSSLIALYNAKYKYPKYRKTLESFDIYAPVDAASVGRMQRSSCTVVLLYAVLVLPFNGLRMWHVLTNHRSPVLMSAFFSMYYLQNISLSCTEIDFVTQCLMVRSKFRGINDELNNINAQYNRSYRKHVCFDRETAAAAAGNDDTPHPHPHPHPPPPPPPCPIAYEKDFYRATDKECPLANIIELLKIKHWLSREALHDLNGIFGYQLGLSIFYIIMTMLFDMYTDIFFSDSNNKTNVPGIRSNILLVGWMLQYSYRFSLIVITAHKTTKQVGAYL